MPRIRLGHAFIRNPRRLEIGFQEHARHSRIMGSPLRKVSQSG
jgi:hypothetical protein